jgi:hypothetical protein
MIPAIRAELRKILTIRSTYVILGLCVAMEFLFAFYAGGIKAQASDLHNSGYLASQVVNAVNALSILIALVGVLLVTHEYRYNTIMYSLTSRRRTQVFMAKLAVIAVFAALFSIIFGLISPLLVELGLHVKGHELVHQVIPAGSLLWRGVFAGWAYSMLALVIAFLVRVQVGAIVTLFLIPTTIESLLGLLLKHNVVYLPFTAISTVLDNSAHSSTSYGKAAVISLIYVVVGWIVAWILFLRRDAN